MAECFCSGECKRTGECPAAREERFQRRNAEGLPIIPPLKPMPKGPADGAVAICGACGRRVMRVESYSCARGDCPVQPKDNSLAWHPV